MHPLLAQTVLMPDDNNQTSADQVSHELPKPLYAEPQSLYNDNPDQAANDEERPAPEAPLPIPSEVAEDSSVTVAAPKSPSNSGAPAHGGDVDDHSYDAVTSGFKKQQNKPSKIYVGNLPNQTREEDLEGCFSELGKIVSVELKIGYGFVEFETREEAERAVQKYDGGLFLGNKIRCELSHGGGKVAKFSGEPGICFKCRQSGHWARECPNPPVDPNWVDHHKGERRPRRHDPPRNRDELAPYPMRSPSGYRDDPRDYRGVPPPRDYRYDDIGRDFRSSRDTRPISPPGRGYSRDYDDLRGMPRPPPMSAGPYDARMPPDPRGFDVRGGLYEPRGPYGYPDYDRPPPPRDYPPTAAPPLSAGAYERGAPPYGAVVPPYMNGRTRSPLPYDTRDVAGSSAPYDPYRGRGAYAPPGGPPGGPPVPPNRYDPYSRRRSMSPPPRSVPPAGYGGYEAGGPPPMPPSTYGGAGGPPYRPQDYPAPPPPSNGYYDPASNGISMYRGGPPTPAGGGPPPNGGRDERDGPGVDRRFPPENGRPPMGAYDRR